jgi:carbonic anhydrase/acetyltransferase-like protein (isoleucine patch superfamily)
MRSVEQQLKDFLRKKPVLGRQVYIARGAVVVGDVTVGDGSSVWYNAVLRGDIHRIVVGRQTNIQDNAVLHVADEYPCLIGDYVTIGHGAIVHACVLGEETLVGMGAVILDGAIVGPRCLIGANALVTSGSKIPEGSLALGSPAKVVRALRPDEMQALRASADKYTQNARYCLENRIQVHTMCRSTRLPRRKAYKDVQQQ